jgi:cell division protease FtsH
MMVICSRGVIALWELSTQAAIETCYKEIEPEHLLAGILQLSSESNVMLDARNLRQEAEKIRGEMKARSIDPEPALESLKDQLGIGDFQHFDDNVPWSKRTREVNNRAIKLTQSEGSDQMNTTHLVHALLDYPDGIIKKLKIMGIGEKGVGRFGIGPKWPSKDWVEKQLKKHSDPTIPLDASIQAADKIDQLEKVLRGKIFGQEHAVDAFIQGLRNSIIVDPERRAPQATFVFAGPPGVGKTFLAETGAYHLERPFKRFDMSAYTNNIQAESLIGMPKGYRDAHPGILTGFVAKNPNAVLLFDEIEKAHMDAIQYFLQVLDAGILEDKYLDRNVKFSETIIIFTTNAGRLLYDRPDATGIGSLNPVFHRKTIIDALRSEENKLTRQPYFPDSLCSRMATGYPVLFNHLGVNELVKVAKSELARNLDLLHGQYGKKLSFEDQVPLCLVLQEGGQTDARTIKAQVRDFALKEYNKLRKRYSRQKLSKIDSILFEMELPEPKETNYKEIKSIFKTSKKPRIMIITEQNEVAQLLKKTARAIDWMFADSNSAMGLLAKNEITFIILDLWLTPAKNDGPTDQTFLQCDNVPLSSTRLSRGENLLKNIRERFPAIPLYLLSKPRESGHDDSGETIDPELFLECVRVGGVRDVIHFSKDAGSDNKLEIQLRDIANGLYRERMAQKLADQHKVITFDTAPKLSEDRKKLSIRLRKIKLVNAIKAIDVGEVIGDVERPHTIFEDVVGADAAKEELKFFIDYLTNPREFQSFGLKPPKGVLLYGPSGCGKTLLAKAMAGESKVAFISAAASSFVTIWQGSGPKNVRELFQRARRYGGIIFIDEIEAIGKVRVGAIGAGQAEELVLNALLTEMDGFSSQSVEKPVFVLAATNFRIKAEEQDSPERSARTLDPALVRRFDKSIMIDLPDTEARKKYLGLHLGEQPNCLISNQAIDLLAEKSIGMSISDLEAIIQSAARIAMRQKTAVNDGLIMEAFDKSKYGEVKEWAPDLLKVTACHEAGHTLLYWLSGWVSPEVSIIARGDHGGGMRRDEGEIKRENLTKNEMLQSIRVALGGRAAELLVYGREEGLRTGAAVDLEHATRIAQRMICMHGMDDCFGMISAQEILKYPDAIGSPIYSQMIKAAKSIISKEMKHNIFMLREYKGLLNTIKKQLLKKNRLYRVDLEEIFAKHKLSKKRD